MDLFNKKKLKEKDTIIEAKRNRISKLIEDNVDLSRSNQHLIKISEDLQIQNQKLTDWIEKIINEVGIKTNNKYENSTITIPYYENKKPYYIEGDYSNPSFEQKDILIPSIRFTKFKYKEEE